MSEKETNYGRAFVYIVGTITLLCLFREAVETVIPFMFSLLP